MPPSSVHSVEMHVQLTPAQESGAGKRNKQGMHGDNLPSIWLVKYCVTDYQTCEEQA